MDWVAAGKIGELVIQYNWPNAARTTWTPYEIIIKEEGGMIQMHQVNDRTKGQRKVRRLCVATA